VPPLPFEGQPIISDLNIDIFLAEARELCPQDKAFDRLIDVYRG
jgi:hypothetical protein